MPSSLQRACHTEKQKQIACFQQLAIDHGFVVFATKAGKATFCRVPAATRPGNRLPPRTVTAAMEMLTGQPSRRSIPHHAGVTALSGWYRVRKLRHQGNTWA